MQRSNRKGESNEQKITATGAAIAAFLTSAAASSGACAEPVAPTESQGACARLIGALDLAAEIEAVQGRQLRMRLVSLAPDGVFAVRSHKNRPTVEYIVSGSATERRGGNPKGYKDGDSVLADKETVHSTPTVFLAVDVFQPPQ